MRTIKLPEVARALGLPKPTIKTWIREGYFDLPKGRQRVGRDYSFAQALTIALFADLISGNYLHGEAREETVKMMRSIGGIIDALVAAPEKATKLDRLIFVKATLVDEQDGRIEQVDRLLISSEDVVRAFGYVSRKRIVEMSLRDVAPLLAKLRHAFTDAPAEQREREYA